MNELTKPALPTLPKIKCQQCGKVVSVPPDAKHKRFCSNACRNKWHLARRKKALELLEKAEDHD
jgi:endogenous inhibitor of DNA gyrase (YacG/DUF329 family)